MPNPIDKRNTDVFITDSALELLEKTDELIENRYTILNRLNESEISILINLLNKVLDDT